MKSVWNRKAWLSGTASALLSMYGCGGSSVSLTDLSSMIPSLGISSPTARGTGASSSLMLMSRFSGGSDQVQFLSPGPSWVADGVTELKPIQDVKTDVSSILGKTSASDCFNGIAFQAFSKQISCYGPTLAFSGHPGGSPTGGQNQCTGISSISSGNCLPSGDLGMWSETDGTEGEACAAAQMNALVGDVAATVNTGIKMMAGVVCLAENKGKELPKVGETIDLASDMNSALSGASMTQVSLSRLDDYTGTSNPVYSVSISGTFNGSSVAITLKHSPSSTSSDFKGRIYGTIGLDTSNTKGFSVVYDQTSTTLKYKGLSAVTPTSAGTSGLFDTDGNYKFDTFLGTSGTRDARYFLASVHATTGVGTLKFAWQAGGNDKKARVFQAHTQTNSGSADTGFAYFGFGPKVGDSSLGTISGMCCNWAGPGGQCIIDTTTFDASSKAQNQVLTRNSSGIFIPSSSAITYAPTNTCNYTNGSSFKYGTVTEWGSTGSGLSDHATVSNNLGALTAVGTIPTLTEPTF